MTWRHVNARQREHTASLACCQIHNKCNCGIYTAPLTHMIKISGDSNHIVNHKRLRKGKFPKVFRTPQCRVVFTDQEKVSSQQTVMRTRRLFPQLFFSFVRLLLRWLLAYRGTWRDDRSAVAVTGLEWENGLRHRYALDASERKVHRIIRYGMGNQWSGFEELGSCDHEGRFPL